MPDLSLRSRSKVVSLERERLRGSSAKIPGSEPRVTEARNPEAPWPRRRESSGCGIPRSCRTEVMFSSVRRWRVFSPIPQRSFSATPSRNASVFADAHLDEPVGLARVRGHLREVLVRPDAHGDGQARALLHLRLQPRAGVPRGTEQPLGSRQVEERLVDRDLLQVRRVPGEDLHHLAGHLEVALHAHREVHALRAAAVRLGDGHGGVDAEPPRLVGARRDDAAPPGRRADDDRLGPSGTGRPAAPRRRRRRRGRRGRPGDGSPGCSCASPRAFTSGSPGSARPAPGLRSASRAAPRTLTAMSGESNSAVSVMRKPWPMGRDSCSGRGSGGKAPTSSR